MPPKTNLCQTDSMNSRESSTSTLPIDGVQTWKTVDYVNGATVSIADNGNYIKFAQSRLSVNDETARKL